MITRDYAELLRKRILLNEACKTNDKLKSTALYQCSNDIIFWFDNFAWTYDPRISPSNVPFILHQKQINYINWLEDLLKRSRQGEKINALVDKPRTVGVSCTTMGWILHHYLFDDFSVRIGSRKENYVDERGETDALFFKIDYIIDRLPEWMKPNNIKGNRTYMMLSNPNNDNVISGESANPNFGRGGRKSVTLFDEFGFWEWAKSSWESAGETTNLRLAVSTPPETGRDSHWYKLLTGQKGRVEKFEFDWKDVPSRDEAWLKQQKATKSDAEFNREVLKSFEGTVEGKVYAHDFHFAKLSQVDYDPNLPLFVSWDFGLDETALIWLQKDFETNKVYIIDTFNKSDKSVDFFIPFITGEIESGNHQYENRELEIIKRHKDYRAATHYGDPDVNKRSYVDKRSASDILEKAGIYVQTKSNRSDHLSIREITRMLFRRMEINEDRSEYFLDAIRNARYPQKSENSQSTSPIIKPIHDWTSHYRTSLEYFADNEPTREKHGAVLTDKEENLPTNPTTVDGFIEEYRIKKQGDWRYE